MVCFSPDGQPLSKSALKKLEKEKEKAKKKAEKQAKLVRTPPPPQIRCLLYEGWIALST
jgi:hypothetical protein